MGRGAQAGQCPLQPPPAPYSPLDRGALGPRGSRAIRGGRPSRGGRRGLGPPEMRATGGEQGRGRGSCGRGDFRALGFKGTGVPPGLAGWQLRAWSVAQAGTWGPAVRPPCVVPGTGLGRAVPPVSAFLWVWGPQKRQSQPRAGAPPQGRRRRRLCFKPQTTFCREAPEPEPSGGCIKAAISSRTFSGAQHGSVGVSEPACP